MSLFLLESGKKSSSETHGHFSAQILLVKNNTQFLTSIKRLTKNSEQVKELCEQYEKKIQLVKIEEKPVPIAPVEPRIVVKNPKLQEISRDDVSFQLLLLSLAAGSNLLERALLSIIQLWTKVHLPILMNLKYMF